MARAVFPDARQLAARIPKRLHRAVKLAALNEGVTACDWIADALESHLRRCRGREVDDDGPGRPKATLTTRAPGAA